MSCMTFIFHSQLRGHPQPLLPARRLLKLVLPLKLQPQVCFRPKDDRFLIIQLCLKMCQPPILYTIISLIQFGFQFYTVMIMLMKAVIPI